MEEADKIISKLKLQPHPEGGYFRETYRSAGEIAEDSLDLRFKGSRSYSTCIYFLLKAEEFSAFHKIHQDEIWHFYDGSPIRLHMITPSGEYSVTIICCDIEHGQIPQFIVPGESWFAAEVVNRNDYSLVGCTVSPGFDFGDFELASREELLKLFPQHKEIIIKLTID
jgi:uncharacterized protein